MNKFNVFNLEGIITYNLRPYILAGTTDLNSSTKKHSWEQDSKI